MSRLDDAFRILDHAYNIILERGEGEIDAGFAELLYARHGGGHITFRSSIKDLSKPATVKVGRLVLRGDQPLPYAIEIFAPKKVFNIEWSDSGEFHLRSFRRGDWEGKLLAE